MNSNNALQMTSQDSFRENCDIKVWREIYSTDASIYQIRPLGVACPKHRDDVVTLVQYAREAGIPIIPRGAGTGLAGGALGRGLIIDCARHLTEIESISDNTVRVQTGVVRDQLNNVLRPYGRYFAPDPAATAVTTVGGMLAVDAAGSHAVRVGSVRDHVQTKPFLQMAVVSKLAGFIAGVEAVIPDASRSLPESTRS